MHSVLGSEGIIIHNNKIVIGMKKEKRCYNLKNNKKGAIVKTIGGSIEKEDNGSLKKALLREITEEIKNITIDDLNISHKRIFEKEILIGDLNPFDNSSSLKMKANFYKVIINSNNNIVPNDLPFLFEIPINIFINLEYNKIINIDEIKKYIVKGYEDVELPEFVSLFVPEEVRKFLRDNYKKLYRI